MIVFAVAALLLVAAGGVWAVSRSGDASPDASPDTASAPATPGQSASGQATASSAEAPASSGNPGTPGAPTGRSRVDTAGPDAHRAPARSGEPLKQLMQAPEKTMLALPADKYAAGLTATVVFEPYGMGPPGFGPSVAAKLISFDSQDSGLPDLEGRNVVLVLDGAKIDAGGRYSGTVTTRVFGDQTALMLTNVEEKR